MHALMQRRNLTIISALKHAARHHGTTDIVSRRDDGSIHRTSYAGIWDRVQRLGSVLRELGVKPDDRVATLAMNSDRHLELYYAISGVGAICNTINPRLAPDDIGWIAAHAEDGLIFADPGFFPLVQQIAPALTPIFAPSLCLPTKLRCRRIAPCRQASPSTLMKT